MAANKIVAVSPFGVLVGDTYPSPSVSLMDGDGVVDPTGMTISLERWDATGAQTSVPGVIAVDVIDFPWPIGDTLANMKWQTMVKIIDGAITYSLSSPVLYVHDPALMFCSVQDVIAIAGPGYSQYEVLRAIELAESVVRAWVTTPIPGPPVPDRVRMATAILAARALASASGGGAVGGDIIEERIADYSVRYSEPQGAESPLFIDDQVGDLLLPWKMRAYSTNIGEERGSLDVDDETVGVIP